MSSTATWEVDLTTEGYPNARRSDDPNPPQVWRFGVYIDRTVGEIPVTLVTGVDGSLSEADAIEFAQSLLAKDTADDQH